VSPLRTRWLNRTVGYRVLIGEDLYTEAQVLSVQRGTAVALGGALGLLLLLSVVDGLGPVGWLTGLTVAAAVNLLLGRAVRSLEMPELLLPNRITLLRAMLVAGVAALVADALLHPSRHHVAIVAVATVALVLDAVDGYVARRTDVVTPLGARFDMEVDAFLIAVLSGYAIASVGVWVSAIGAARYVYWAVGRPLPALRIPVPPRYWRKVVAAIQGIVLTVVAAHLLPTVVGAALATAALVLLAESFGRDVWWQVRTSRAAATRTSARTPLALAGSR
jgi:phosphatidylglycerophosphate synthase